jgi:hypothetical protein
MYSQMETDDLIYFLNKELSVELPEKIPYAEIQAQLAAYINNLVKNDFDKLIAYLYRIDVNEQKLKLLLRQFPEEDAGNIIASLIIERQQQKIKTREQFRQRENDMPAGQADFDEEEKW